MKLWKWWQRHRTWVLGTTAGIITGFIGIDGLISHDHIKYWAAAGVVVSVLIAQGGISIVKQGNTP